MLLRRVASVQNASKCVAAHDALSCELLLWCQAVSARYLVLQKAQCEAIKVASVAGSYGPCHMQLCPLFCEAVL